jgi:hypothetical protein
MLLNLFSRDGPGQREGKHLLPDSVVKIRDQANLRKLADARKLLAEFLSQEGPEASSEPLDAFSEPNGAAVLVPFWLAVGQSHVQDMHRNP